MSNKLLGLLKTSGDKKDKVYEDFITGYYNSNKLKSDLTDIINSEKYGSISLILFKFDNMDMIKRYVDFETSITSYIKLHNMAEEYFCYGTIYTVLENRIAVLLPGIKTEEAINLANEFIVSTKNPIHIDNLPISLVIMSSIVNYPTHGTDASELIKKLDKALEQSCRSHNSIEVYDSVVAKEQERYYKDLVSLYDALKNNMFTLAFQPIIDIKKNRITCVEALLRWDEIRRKNMSILELIEMAEDAGFINEISRWLFTSVTEQLNIWEGKGIKITVSMNLSAKDLLDETFIDYVKNYIETNNLNAKYIQFELTERSIIQDYDFTLKQLKRLRNMGIKLSLDDYGTGNNSLKKLIDFSGRFDYLKIDKYFIDLILKDEKLIIVDCIIKAAHRLGMKVIAEGVEIKEQVEILKTVNCDMIQGFYYSKPLTPEELEQYIITFS